MFQSAVESHSSGLRLTFQGASLTPDLFFQRSGSQPWTKNSFICISSEFYVHWWRLIVSKLVVLFNNSRIIFQQLSSEENDFPLQIMAGFRGYGYMPASLPPIPRAVAGCKCRTGRPVTLSESSWKSDIFTSSHLKAKCCFTGV